MTKFAIYGAPRSGTTWLGELINASEHVCYKYQPLFSYCLKGALTENSSKEEIDTFYQKLLLEETDNFLNQLESRKAGILPSFTKKDITHVGYKEVRYHNLLPSLLMANKNIKYIFIIRNPIDVLNSWLNAPREFRADLGWKPKEEWRYARLKNQDLKHEFNGYEKWKAVALMYLALAAKYPEQVQLISYKELLQSTSKQVKLLYDFLDLKYSQQTKDFISNRPINKKQQIKSAYSVYKIDTKKTIDFSLDTEAIEYIAGDLKGTTLEQFLK